MARCRFGDVPRPRRSAYRVYVERSLAEHSHERLVQDPTALSSASAVDVGLAAPQGRWSEAHHREVPARQPCGRPAVYPPPQPLRRGRTGRWIGAQIAMLSGQHGRSARMLAASTSRRRNPSGTLTHLHDAPSTSRLRQLDRELYDLGAEREPLPRVSLSKAVRGGACVIQRMTWPSPPSSCTWVMNLCRVACWWRCTMPSRSQSRQRSRLWRMVLRTPPNRLGTTRPPYCGVVAPIRLPPRGLPRVEKGRERRVLRHQLHRRGLRLRLALRDRLDCPRDGEPREASSPCRSPSSAGRRVRLAYPEVSEDLEGVRNAARLLDARVGDEPHDLVADVEPVFPRGGVLFSIHCT